MPTKSYRLKHKSSGLYLEVENIGTKREVDYYTKDSTTTFPDKESARKAAKRFKLTSKDYVIE